MKVLISEKLSPHKYKTPEGYLICVDAVLARTGKQTYRRCEIFNDDSEEEIEVDRKPEEVFSEATLASFENKPVTLEHPNEDVNSGNFKDYAVGFVRDVKRGVIDGQDVILGTLVIQDEEIINEIENGEHTELSCGYDADIKDEKNPQQRNIRGNHVALCQCGRAGNARIVDSQKVNDVKYFAVSKYDSGKYNNINSALSDLINFGEDDEVKLYSLKNEKDVQNLYSDDLIGIYKNGKLIEKGPAFTKRFNADSVKDAYYTIGGYSGKYDPVAMTDIKRAARYGVNGSIERTSDGWQLVLRGTPDNLRNALENYFALDPSGIEDSMKDEKSTYTRVTENLENNLNKFEDEEIFTVNVKNAENEEVSRFLTEAQNLGFTTDDRGYTIYLKEGTKHMLNQLKSKMTTINIKFEDDDYKFKVANKYGRVIYSFKTREEAEHMINSLTKNGDYGYHIKDNIKDYAPPYAVWVKKNGKWIIYGGSNSQNVNKDEYLKAGYEDVKVVKNGESVQDSKQVSEEEIKEYMKKTGFSYPDAKRALEEEDSDFVEKMRHHQYDEIKDDTFKYEISWKDTYSQIKYDDIFKGTSVKDVLEQLAKTVGMRGIGTANTYINSIHRFNKDGSTSYYPRAYGKLNSMLGQTYDSCKARDSKISKIINLYKIAKKLR